MTWQIGSKAWYDNREPVQVSAVYTGNDADGAWTLYDIDSVARNEGWGEISPAYLSPRTELMPGERAQSDDAILEIELGPELTAKLRQRARQNGHSPSQEVIEIIRTYLDNQPTQN